MDIFSQDCALPLPLRCAQRQGRACPGLTSCAPSGSFSGAEARNLCWPVGVRDKSLTYQPCPFLQNSNPSAVSGKDKSLTYQPCLFKTFSSVAPTGLGNLMNIFSQDCALPLPLRCAQRRGWACPGLISCAPSGSFSGAEAPLILRNLMYGLKPVPT